MNYYSLQDYFFFGEDGKVYVKQPSLLLPLAIYYTVKVLVLFYQGILGDMV